MPTVTLQTKIYNNFQLKQVEKFLKATLKGLNVKTEFCGLSARGWVQIGVSGEDERAALRYLIEKIGLCPTNLEDVKKFSLIRGHLIALNKSKNELYVDVGVSSPKIIDAVISLRHMQAQLVDGRKVALQKIMEVYGFCENQPLEVKISGINKESNCLDAVFSEKQLNQFRGWAASLLDRLIIIGSSIYHIKAAFKKAGVNRDILTLEPLGLFEFAAVCKLGTDAAGLIAKIGKLLPNAILTVFNPRKVQTFLNY